ncbi:MAG: hypothetical protein H0U41_10155 [Actinobacteria bacterium]|nr:hypothetical protein [Actinomycetota bacterium]
MSNVPLGAVVTILFAGTEVAQATAPDQQAAATGAPVLLGGVALPAGAGAGTTTVEIPFEVPNVRPGSYVVTATGDTFSANAGFRVVATGQGSGGGRSIPRTGVYAALMVAVAIGLVLAGRAALEGSRRRKRRVSRGARTEATHFAGASTGERSSD